MTSGWAQTWTSWPDRKRSILDFHFSWSENLNNLYFQDMVGVWWGRQDSGWVGDSLTHTHTPPHLNCPFTAFAAHPTRYCPLLLPAQRSVIHPCGALTFRFLSASHSHTAALGMRGPASCRTEPVHPKKQHSGFISTGHTESSARAF